MQVTWFNWNVLIWVLCITHKLGLNILYEKAGEQWERVYHVLGWGVGLILAVIPLAMDMYGPSGVWCWIKENEENTTALRFGIWCECTDGLHCTVLFSIPCLPAEPPRVCSGMSIRCQQWHTILNRDVGFGGVCVLWNVADVPLWIAIVALFIANFSIIRNVQKRERRWEG